MSKTTGISVITCIEIFGTFKLAHGKCGVGGEMDILEVILWYLLL
jgi:hypothetical protein